MESSQQSFDRNMSPTTKRKRRTFAEYEKERIRLVRKRGACLECKVKKRKCSHVSDEMDDGASPSTQSDGSDPQTPGSDSMVSLEDDAHKPVPVGFDFGDYLVSEAL